MVQAFARCLGLFEKGQVSCYGLTPQQAYTLQLIGASPGITMGTLSERLGIATSTLTRNVEKLEQERIVVRNRASDDARAVGVVLTDAGRTKLQQVQDCYETCFQKILECIGPEDRETVLKGLRILVRAFRECRFGC